MRPDADKPTYQLFKPEQKIPPTIIFGTTALKWIMALVDIHPLEVGFYASVDKRTDGSYFIRDVYYPKHSEMNAGTCEISPEGETDLMNWLIDNGREADIEKIRLWGHSHHSMTTGPSGQDEKQAMERMTTTQSFLIRAIANKQGEMAVSFFDYQNQIRFDHIKWSIEIDENSTYYEEKSARIKAVMDDQTKTGKVRIQEIDKIVSEDTEMDSIRLKVIELQKINTPPVKTYQYPGNSWSEQNEVARRSNFFPGQTHMFERDSFGYRTNRKGKKKGKEVGGFGSLPNFPPNVPDGRIDDENDVDSIMNDWERQAFYPGA